MDVPNRTSENRPAQGEGVNTIERHAGRSLSQSDFLRTLFRLLDEHQIRYCVLHSWQGLPDTLPSDLDLAVHPRDRAKLPSVFQDLRDEGYQPIQRWQYRGRGAQFDFAWFEPAGMRSARIDVTDGYWPHALILMPGEELVCNRQQFKGFWVAHPAVEFSYLLAKKTLKGTLHQQQAERLKALVNELRKPQAQKIAGELFGDRWKERVVEACTSGTLSGLLGQLKKQLWLTKLRKDPLTPLRYLLRVIPRLIGRTIKPIGLFLVILGPDGVGKSTLVGPLAESLQSAAFNRFRLFHWRPMLIAPQKETGLPSTDPHGEPPRGPFGSIVALFGILLDYWLGFIFILRPILTRAGLVVFDRYYQDLLIDPLRYRYGGPMWLAKLVSRFVPAPDLLFLVDAEDEVILSRKREVPPEELRRQREGYHQFALGDKRPNLIRTDQGIELSVGEAARLVVEYLTHRFERRYAR
jgi:thymidylate kinase